MKTGYKYLPSLVKPKSSNPGQNPRSPLYVGNTQLLVSAMTSYLSHPPETGTATVTSWVPLTTAFPYQSGCSTAYWARWGFSAGYNAVAFDPAYGTSVDSNTICLPSAVTEWWDQGGSTSATITSIGPIVCPEAYTTASTSILNSLSTFVVCCPSCVPVRLYYMNSS